jgi:hypothetical protein
MANPFPFVAGNVLTAAELNGIGEAWTSYTPAITQGVAITKTVDYAKYTRVNKFVVVSVALNCTSAGTASNTIQITLPVASVAAAGAFGQTFGAGGFYDLSTTQQYNLTAQLAGTTIIGLYGNGSGGSLFGQFPAVTIASGDRVFFNAIYEVA